MFRYDGCQVLRHDPDAATYREFYGDENPWVRWLEERAPELLEYSPLELRIGWGIPPVRVPGFSRVLR